jgi:hypothetical protein
VSHDVAIAGRVAMEGGLEYDPGSGALFIRKIRVVETHIDSVPPKVASLLDAVGGVKSLDRVFNEVSRIVPPRIADVKIAELPGDWRGQAARAVIRSVRVGGDGVDVEVGLPGNGR